MSDNSQQPQQQVPQLLDPDTAYAVIHQRVYAPVFFDKLAHAYGIQPRNEAEALEMLAITAQLRAAYEVDTEKQAAAVDPDLLTAQMHLSHLLPEAGYGQYGSSLDEIRGRDYIKQAAAQASFDPELSHATLSLQTHAAIQQYQQENQHAA